MHTRADIDILRGIAVEFGKNKDAVGEAVVFAAVDELRHLRAQNVGANVGMQRVRALANTMWQLLDDMGKDGLCVCSYAKAQARVAYEPFRIAESEAIGEDVPCDASLADAEALIAAANRHPKRGCECGLSASAPEIPAPAQ